MTDMFYLNGLNEFICLYLNVKNNKPTIIQNVRTFIAWKLNSIKNGLK